MSFSKMTGAAVLLALAPSAMAVGTAHVVNNCGFPIYYASVSQSAHASMSELTGTYSETYDKANNGVSIKLAPSASGHVSQFEFTWADGKINYDLSNIDGYPFADGGMSVVPSNQGDSSNPTCVPINCPAGEAYCSAAYNLPDDVRTHVCSEDTDLVLTMCPGGSSGSATGSDTPTSTESAATGTSSEAATPVASETTAAAAPATSSSTHSWGGPPTKRGEHIHQRAHSRAFRV